MPNLEATFQARLSYTGPNSESVTAPNISVAAPYAAGAQQVGGIDVPDAASSSTEYSVAFGSIAAATGILIENKTGQELRARIESAVRSVTGTLASGTVTMALAAVPGERLSVEVTTSGGTPGKLHVRRSSGNVIVESYNSSGIETGDTSIVTVYNNAPIPLPDDAVLMVATPAAPSGSAIAAASVRLTASQSGAGSVVTKVFGDPT